MNTIIDHGKQGAEYVADVDVPVAEALSPELVKLVANLKKLPLQKIEVDADVGVRKSIDVRSLPLDKERGFKAAHLLAAHELMVYALKGGKTVMGMLSPNYDTHGDHRLPSIKVIPLKHPEPLTVKQQPNAEMMTMLTGAVSAERKGAGSHHASLTSDFEHRATFLGAISLGDPTVAIQHKNHAVRQYSSVASGLDNGKLGNIYVPAPGFSGFAEPVVFEPDTVQVGDTLFIPDSFLDETDAFGVTYGDASQIMLGAGFRTLAERHGSDGIAIVQKKIQNLARMVPQHV